MAVKSRRSYKGAAVSNTLGSQLLVGGTTISLAATMSGWPTSSEPFFCVIDPGTAKEEKVCVVYATTTTLTVVDPADFTSPWGASANGRGVDNTTAYQHEAGAVIYPCITARDIDEANELVSKYGAQGSVVYQGASTFTELAVGTAGQVLKVNSGATAPEWGQVATAGIADSAVTSAKIADGTIATDDLADGAVTSAKIADGTIVDADVSASAAIALSKLATGALPTSITVASANIVDGTITASDTNFGGAWTAFTPTCSNTTVTASDCRYQVIGKTAFVSIMLQTTGTATASYQTLGSLPAAITPRGWSGFNDWKIIGSGSFGTVNLGFWFVKRDGTLEFRAGYAPGSPSFYVAFTTTQVLGTIHLTGNLVYEIA